MHYSSRVLSHEISAVMKNKLSPEHTRINRYDRLYAREVQQLLDLGDSAILKAARSAPATNSGEKTCLKNVNKLPVRCSHFIRVHYFMSPSKLKDLLIEFRIRRKVAICEEFLALMVSLSLTYTSILRGRTCL